MVRMLSVATIEGTLSEFLLPFAEHFRAQGWRVDAMAQGVTDSPECCAAFDRVWDITWSRNPLDPRNLLKAAPAVRRLVERERYDLVHVHTPVAAFVTRYALKNLPAFDGDARAKASKLPKWRSSSSAIWIAETPLRPVRTRMAINSAVRRFSAPTEAKRSRGRS